MDLLKPLTLAWWQLGLFKLGMLALGCLIGAYWHELFAQGYAVLAVVAIGALGYISYVWLKASTPRAA